MSLVDEMKRVLNHHSAENGSDTPDFILAEFLLLCLRAWNDAVQMREKWYGRPMYGGNDVPASEVDLSPNGIPIPAAPDTTP
jgi:hypothetical protein